MEKNEIEMSPSQSNTESFEEDEKNILRVSIQLPTGEMIDSSNYRVALMLSKEAMLGIAISLIRFVHGEDKRIGFWHLHPSELNFSSQVLGVYLHPKSCELMVSENNFGCLEDILAESEPRQTSPPK